ncbi:hypothetical protein ACL58G_11730 [Massilia sp. GER05]|uniref:hypothetical protein n=1 Tax=Massilia sp. GER05 TaxID=3394605 RepID=UPI003F835DD0
MPSPIQDDIAQSILAKEKRKADARAVLNRPDSIIPTCLVTALLVGVGVYLQSIDKFEAPAWVVILLIVGVSSSFATTMELWKMRRRLDAMILLQDQQASDR